MPSKTRTGFYSLKSPRVIAVTLVATLAVIVSGLPGYAASPAAINLGNSTSFAVLANTYITTGAASTINGDIGAGRAITTGAESVHSGSLFAGAAITTGANNVIEGSLSAVGAITNGAGTSIQGSQNAGQRSRSASYTSAMSALNLAMVSASRRTATVINSALGGMTLTPGVYSAGHSGFLSLSGTVTLDAQGNTNAVFIIKSPSYLVTASDSLINLTNGAQAENVFWVTRSYISLGANSSIEGNLLAAGYITLGADAAVQGRIFSQKSYVLFGTSGPGSSFGLAGIGTTTTPVNTALTPTVSSLAPTSDGFTFSVTNFDGSYSWSGTATNGGSVAIDSAGLVSVTGVALNTESTATILAVKSGVPTGSKDVSATSLAAGLTSHTPTSDGFTVEITNFDDRYTWSGTATNGGSVTIDSAGLVSVTGVAPNTRTTATITSTKTGARTTSRTVSATSLAASMQKITVGSFKGYVAVYAMNYEGQRLTAKIGKDWVIVPSVPASVNNVYRWVEPTGFGVYCKVRVFIDRKLAKTVYLTTK